MAKLRITRRMLFVAAFGVVAAMLIARCYFIQRAVVGVTVWNDREAYVFVEEYDAGYSFSYAGYCAEFLRQMIPFGASSPEMRAYRLDVIYIGSDSISKAHLGDFRLSEVYPSQNSVIATNLSDTNPGPLKWKGSATPLPLEQVDIQQIPALAEKEPSGPRYDGIQGWHKQRFDLTESGSTKEIGVILSGVPFVLTLKAAASNLDAEVTLQHGNLKESLWRSAPRLERISRKEYRRLFASR